MKRAFIGLLIIILLMLDFAALDDITTGNEPTLLGEYLVLAGSIMVYAILGFLYIKKRKTKKDS